VATTLLVAGSTPTFWIPQLVSTSSYSSVVQPLGCLHNYRRLTYGLFQLTHVTWWQCSSIDRAMVKTEHYYSAHNVATTVSFDT